MTNLIIGLITPPIIFASSLNLDSATSAYLISASLIGCGTYSWQVRPLKYDSGALVLFSGILSLLQMSRIKLFGGYYIGTGLISGKMNSTTSYIPSNCCWSTTNSSCWDELFHSLHCNCCKEYVIQLGGRWIELFRRYLTHYTRMELAPLPQCQTAL